MTSTLLDVHAIVGDHSGLSRTVLDYTLEMKRTVDRAKEPGFDASSWEPLGRLVTTDDFTRVGPFKDQMTWPDYVAFLTGWASQGHWECSFRRITEAPDMVFLELEERTEPDNPTAAVNSLSIYEFDAEDRIRHLDVYLQMAMPARSGSA